MRVSCFIFILALGAVQVHAATPQFSSRQDIATGFQKLTGLAVADFNGDGKPDIAVTDVFSKRVVVYLNTGNGTFSAPISTPLQFPAVSTGPIVAGDFNEDGKQDLIFSTVAGSQQDILLTGNGDGTFTQQPALPGSFGFISATVIDLNHDSHLDLIEGNNGSLDVYLGDGRGNFTLQTLANQGLSDLFTAVTSADFNNDRNNDFVIAGYFTNSLRLFSGDGTGSFSTPTNLSSDHIFSPSSIASADFNGDGHSDLLVGSANIASVILGNGDGTFRTGASEVVYLHTPVGSPGVGVSPSEVNAADMNGDGIQDAVVIDQVTNTINVFLNDGTGTFPQTAPDFSAALLAGSGNLALADLNGDGLPDIIITNYLTQNISVFLSIKTKTTPVVSLSSSANQQLAGTPLTFSVRVTSTGSNMATGTAMLLDGATVIGQQSLDASGQATFSVSNLSAATHTLTISYSGDNNFLPAVSRGLVQSVTDFQISLPVASQSVSRGFSATYSPSFTPLAGFTGNVAITCAGLPATSTCIANTVALAGAPATTTVTVTTTAASNLITSPGSAGISQGLGFGLLSLLLCAWLPRQRTLLRLASVVGMAVGIGVLVGCSTASTNAASTGSTPSTTTFTIIGTATQGSLTVSHQVSATLTVN